MKVKHSMKPRDLREALQGKLRKEEMKKLVTSFDFLGNIALIEVPIELEKKRKIIGGELMKVNPSIKTVLRIKSPHKGKYRIQSTEIIAGEKNFIADYKESGCRFIFDVRKVFFSTRLSSERLRIAKLIKKNEVIGAFFAGIGPYPIVFARNSPMKKAFAVELNPHAIKFMKKNIELNKCKEKIEAIKGDVKKIASTKLKGKCDRIVMPLPHGGENFLASALKALKPKGTIHFYQLTSTENPFEEPIKIIEREVKKTRKKYKILFKKEARPFSAAKIQAVIDFRVN